jgi:hypothetical protein
MVNLKLFNIYVTDTMVRKGYDWVILPDGTKIGVTPGKYMRITPNGFAFEDITEEAGEGTPDYDFDEPACTVSESGFIVKKVTLKCVAGIGRVGGIDLYYGDKLIASGLKGYGELPPIQFSYVSMPEMLGLTTGIGALGALIALARKRK